MGAQASAMAANSMRMMESLSKTIDQNKQIRQQRLVLENVQKALAIEGHTQQDIIKAAMAPAPKQSMFKNFMANINPGAAPTGIQNEVVGSQLGNALTRSQSLLTPDQQVQEAEYKGGLRSRPSTSTYQDQLTDAERRESQLVKGGLQAAAQPEVAEFQALTDQFEQDLNQYNKDMGTLSSFGPTMGAAMTPEQKAMAVELKGRTEESLENLSQMMNKMIPMANALAKGGGKDEKTDEENFSFWQTALNKNYDSMGFIHPGSEKNQQLAAEKVEFYRQRLHNAGRAVPEADNRPAPKKAAEDTYTSDRDKNTQITKVQDSLSMLIQDPGTTDQVMQRFMSLTEQEQDQFSDILEGRNSVDIRDAFEAMGFAQQEE